MEQKKVEASEQHVLNVECLNEPMVGKSTALPLAPVKRTATVKGQDLETNIASVTPEKTTESFHTKYKKEAAELPEKYRIMSEIFDRMTCSLRLLKLRNKSPVFRNVCRQVEVLTGRKFSYQHLAQMKYLFPESVQTEKVLVHDEKTMCMKPELKINLLLDVVEGLYQQSSFTALSQVFASRLLEFFSAHPEGCEIPEAELPEPFNQSRITISMDTFPTELSLLQPPPNSTETELLNSSHIDPSFNRRLSQKAVLSDSEKTNLLSFPVPCQSPKRDSMTKQDVNSGQEKESPNSCSRALDIASPFQLTHSSVHVNSSISENTPTKIASRDDYLVVETPVQLAPKRSVPSCNNKTKTFASQILTERGVAAKRSLDFSRLEGEESSLQSTLEEMDQHEIEINILPRKVETEGTLMPDVNFSASCLQKVDKSSSSNAKDHGISRSGLISKNPTSACLTELVTLIHRIFQSASCPSITKQELVHKIMINNCDIVDTREVEEQMDLLEKLVPDWIVRQLVPSGDLLYSIKKVPDLQSVCEKVIGM